MAKLDYTDHDLLIKVDTNLDNLSKKVDNVSTDLVARMAKVEARLDSNDIDKAGAKANLRLLTFVALPILTALTTIIASLILKALHIL